MTSSKQIDLDYFIVAFVDILGFSNMVKSDCENKSDSIKYFEVLREINKETQKIGDCNITQFSDSVIFSLPLSQDNYIKMTEILAEYQRKLLYHNIICRGAVAYGKHYKEDDFMFSQALIEAYQLESKDAIYPRIIISKNLLEYFRPTIQNPPYLVQEKDGFYFVDYLSAASKEFSLKCLEEFNRSVHTQSLNVKEKYYWLYKYWEFKFKDTLPFLAPQFI